MRNRTRKRASRTSSRARTPEPDDYQIVVRWSERDGCYLATAPALEGCTTHGRSPVEALRRGQEAVSLWLRDALRHGDPIPKPSHQYSGVLTLRMPTTLHQRMVEESEREGVSINQWIITKLAS